MLWAAGAAVATADIMGGTYSGGCSGVGVGGETGSGEDGSGDCVMDTSDSGARGGGSGIAHSRDTGNSR